jgi:hypothetical protein
MLLTLIFPFSILACELSLILYGYGLLLPSSFMLPFFLPFSFMPLLYFSFTIPLPTSTIQFSFGLPPLSFSIAPTRNLFSYLNLAACLIHYPTRCDPSLVLSHRLFIQPSLILELRPPSSSLG